MSSTVERYRIFCESESPPGYVEGLSENGHLTHCPNNNSHTVVENSSQFIETVNSLLSTVRIQDEFGHVTTGGHVRIRSFTVTAPANTRSKHEIIFKIPVSIFSISFSSKDEHVGDTLDVEVESLHPNNIVGTITSNVAIGDRVINVSASVVMNMFVGAVLKLNTESLGQILEIDTVNNTVTMERESSAAHSPLDTLVTFLLITVEDYTIGCTGPYTWGGNIIGSSFVPRDVPVNVYYDNKHATETRILTFQIDIKY